MLSLIIGSITTLLALTIHIDDYTNFLYLIGGVFVPLSAVLIAAWLRTSYRDWDISIEAPVRPGMIAAWLIGFAVYELINPGSLAHWSGFWNSAGADLQLQGHAWLSASISSSWSPCSSRFPLPGWPKPDEDRRSRVQLAAHSRHRRRAEPGRPR